MTLDLAARSDLVGGHAEQEEVLGPDLLPDLDIRGRRACRWWAAPLSANFMLPVPEASLPAVEICSERSAAGISRSASEDVVVRRVDHLQEFSG